MSICNDNQRDKVVLIMQETGCTRENALAAWIGLSTEYMEKELQNSYNRGFSDGLGLIQH